MTTKINSKRTTPRADAVRARIVTAAKAWDAAKSFLAYELAQPTGSRNETSIARAQTRVWEKRAVLANLLGVEL